MSSQDTLDQELETTAESRARPDWLSVIVSGFLALWIGSVVVVAQTAGWVAAQFALLTGDSLSPLATFAAPIVQTLLILVPCVLLALMWRADSYRALFRFWALAAVFAVLLTPVALPDAVSALASAALQIAGSFVFILLLLLRRRRQTQPAHRRGSSLVALLLALGCAPLIGVPWLREGALGSPLESLVYIGAAMLFGLAMALLIEEHWRSWFPAPGPIGVGRRALAGLAIAVAIMIPATTFGHHGQQLLLLLVVPSLGGIVAALADRRPLRQWVTLLVGIVTAMPLLFVDPRELAIVVAFGLFSLLGFAFQAGFMSFGISLVLGAALFAGRWLLRPRLAREARLVRYGALGFALFAWLGFAGLYLLFGQPGFYGDSIFVVLRDEADTSAAAGIGDPTARRGFVHQTLVDHANESQADLRRVLDRFGIGYTPYYLVNGLKVSGGPFLAAWFERRPEVDRVLYNPALRPIAMDSSATGMVPPPSELLWNLELIGANRVWDEFGVRGSNIIIGQADSGVQWDHPELANGYRGTDGNHNYSWFDPWYGTEAPVDVGGHGTHTLGTILGDNTGVAPDATWFGCANLARNVGSPSLYLDCMQFLFAPFPLDGDPLRDGDPARGAHILNNSWGCPTLEGCDPGSLQAAAKALRTAGLFVVVSAGNDGPACNSLDSPPAIYDEVYTVGAIDRQRTVTEFSSRGPVSVDSSGRTKPDVVAPGRDIVSAYPNSTYESVQGTSMAGPHVAGIVALMWSANPALIGDVKTTEMILNDTAKAEAQMGSACAGAASVPNNVQGHGIVDAYAAVRAAIDLANP